MAVNGGVDSARSRARALLDDVGPGDHDHPDFRDVASGGILWKASLVLLHFLERNVELRGKRVLEISAGEGHLACELQRYGAHVTATEHAGFTAKEVGSDYQRLKASVDARASEQGNGGSIRVVPLTWGEDAWEKSPLAAEEADYDLIVMSELVFEPDLHEQLLWTMRRLCTAKTRVYHIFLDRPFSFMFLAKVDDTGAFDVQAVPEDELDYLAFVPADSGVHMHPSPLSCPAACAKPHRQARAATADRCCSYGKCFLN